MEPYMEPRLVQEKSSSICHLDTAVHDSKLNISSPNLEQAKLVKEEDVGTMKENEGEKSNQENIILEEDMKELEDENKEVQDNDNDSVSKDDLKLETDKDTKSKKWSAGRRELPAKTVNILRQWLLSPDNICHPYPTETDKKMLIASTGIDMKQLTNWFTNARKRIWKPLLAQELARRSQSSGNCCTTKEELMASDFTRYYPHLPSNRHFSNMPSYPFPSSNFQDRYQSNLRSNMPPYDAYSFYSSAQPHVYPSGSLQTNGSSLYPQSVPRTRTCSEPALAGIVAKYQSDLFAEKRKLNRERKRKRRKLSDSIDSCSDNGNETTTKTQDSLPDGETTEKKSKKMLLPLHKTQILKDWMMSPEHILHPYPNENEKKVLCEQTGIEMKQLTNWFTNNRKRYWRPRLDGVAVRRRQVLPLSPGRRDHIDPFHSPVSPPWDEINYRRIMFPSSIGDNHIDSNLMRINNNDYEKHKALEQQREYSQMQNSYLPTERQSSFQTLKFPLERRNNRSNTVDMGTFLTTRGRMNISDVMNSVSTLPEIGFDDQSPIPSSTVPVNPMTTNGSLPRLHQALRSNIYLNQQILRQKVLSPRRRAHSAQVMSLNNLMCSSDHLKGDS